MTNKFPITAHLKLQTRAITQTYKGESFDIIEKYYLDEANDNKEVPDSLTGNATLNQVYNEYRVRHGLPFIDEFRYLREKLFLSYVQMSMILGLGVNQYRLYESGTMPSDTTGRYIKTLIENDSALLKCINNSRDCLTDLEYQRAIRFPKNSDNDNYVFSKLFSKRCKENGYAALNLYKLKTIIQFILNNIENVTPNILNRLLFYLDFISYRQTATAVTGLSYRALPFGPVPNYWKYLPLMDLIEQNEYNNGTVLTTLSGNSHEIFNSYETNVLHSIVKHFRNNPVNEIFEMCRNEPAWIENKDSDSKSISFDYAFKLKHFRHLF